MVGIYKGPDESAAAEDAVLKVVKEEVVRLTEEMELPAPLGFDDGGWRAAETAVINSSNSRLMVSKLPADVGVGYGRKFGLFGNVVVIVVAIRTGVFHRA